MDELEKAIARAVAYFDIHEYPLSEMEIFKWLYFARDEELSSCGLDSVLEKLNNSFYLKNILSFKSGYYFLKGREGLAEKRQKKYAITVQKSKIARRLAKIFSFIPYCEMIAACNDFGFNSLNENSDIDLFIIARQGRIFLVRFLAVAITAILGLRPKGGNKADKICLSFFVADSQLCLRDIAIAQDDVYLTYWLATLQPFFGFKKYFDLIEANKEMLSFLPNALNCNTSSVRSILAPKRFRQMSERILSGKVGVFFENITRYLQQNVIEKKKIPPACPSSVVMNDGMIKMHPTDNRNYYRDEFNNRLFKYYETA